MLILVLYTVVTPDVCVVQFLSNECFVFETCAGIHARSLSRAFMLSHGLSSANGGDGSSSSISSGGSGSGSFGRLYSHM